MISLREHVFVFVLVLVLYILIIKVSYSYHWFGLNFFRATKAFGTRNE